MDRDRKEGAIKKTVGKIKEKAGQLMGDRKTEAEGRKDRMEGEVQNTVGGIKDTVREKDRP
jgi:uncharacterized protein YjbJ (UPF0337 family)